MTKMTKFFKKNKIIVYLLMFVLIVSSSFRNINVCAEDINIKEDEPSQSDKDELMDSEDEEKDGEELPPEKDWTLAENQEDVWEVFYSTDWTNGMALNYNMGIEGIEMYARAEHYDNFTSNFEVPLTGVLMGWDQEESEGKDPLGFNHSFKCIEYRKLICMVLYGMFVLQDDGNGLQCYYNIYGAPDDDASFFVSVKQSIHDSINEYQTKYNKPSPKPLALNPNFISFCSNYLGYSEDEINKLVPIFTEANVMYFGTNRGEEFDRRGFETLIKNILYNLTKYDGTGINSDYEFICDPYEVKNPYMMVLLDSVLMEPKSGPTLFQSFINSSDRGIIIEDFYLKSDNATTNGYSWDYALHLGTDDTDYTCNFKYDEFYRNYQEKYMDDIYFFNYSSDLMEYTGLTEYSDWNNDNVPILPLVSARTKGSVGYSNPGGEGQEYTLGIEYYKGYTAKKILSHKINGISGEIIE